MAGHWYTKPFLTAFLAWASAMVFVFLIIDYSLMPFLTGQFKGTVEVPDIKGLSVSSARETLRARGLKFSVDAAMRDHSPSVAEGLILSQTPEEGSTVKKGRRVWGQLSLGPPGSISASDL